jgi:hypothetical protein
LNRFSQIGFTPGIGVLSSGDEFEGRIDGDGGVGVLRSFSSKVSARLNWRSYAFFKAMHESEREGVIGQSAEGDGGEGSAGLSGGEWPPSMARAISSSKAAVCIPYMRRRCQRAAVLVWTSPASTELRGWSWRARAEARSLKRRMDSFLKTTVPGMSLQRAAL